MHAGRGHFLKTSPLHAACTQGYVDIVRALLAKQALVNWQDTDGSTPLHAACGGSAGPIAQRREIVTLLLRVRKVNAALPDRRGRTPCSLARDGPIRKMIQDTVQVRQPRAGCLQLPGLCVVRGWWIGASSVPLQQQAASGAVQGLRPAAVAAAARKEANAKAEAANLAAVPLPKHVPVVTSPHPVIAGHRWAEPRPSGDPLLGTTFPPATLEPSAPPQLTEQSAPLTEPLPAFACSVLPASFLLPPAGKPSARAAHMSPADALEPPFALSSKATTEDGGSTHAGCLGWVAGRMRAEQWAWAAAGECARQRSAFAKRSARELQPADAMWFDTTEPLVAAFPVRRQLGRYGS